MFGIGGAYIRKLVLRSRDYLWAINPKNQLPLDFHIDTTGHIRPLGLVRPLATSSVPLGDFQVPSVPKSDWREFDETATPGYPILVKDQDQKGACFPPGTHVRMSDGTQKKIEDVRLLDEVLTAEGNFGTVVRTMVRQAGPTILKLNLLGHSHLRLTEEHPVLTKRGYVAAKELTEDDWVAIPKYMASGVDILGTRQYLSGRTLDTHRAEQDETTVWRRVRKVEEVSYSGPVYNLEVEGDNSYVAEGVGVHNCNGHATASSMERARWLQGQTYTPLSAWFVYSILCGGWDRGSSIGEALTLIQQKGVAPEADVQWGLINPTRLSKQAYSDALNYKCEVGVALTTWEDIMSAVQLKLPVNMSIRVGGRFELDKNGVVSASRGAGNHAIAVGHGAKKLPDGTWAVKWQNSWTTQWGDNGYAWLIEAHWDNQSYSEAWALRTIAENPSDPDKPPVVLA